MNAEENRTLGGLTTAIDGLRGAQEVMRHETREDFGRVFKRLEEIQAGGYEQRIIKLERRPEKTVSMLAAVMSILAGVFAVLAFWKN